ncbi:hypothetical protein L1887_17445 [Cichorium endivia]|nr:hypothetical protein L1887_17445 [Cichorium endivia]
MTGGVCVPVSSKALTITGIGDRRYWNDVPSDESSLWFTYRLVGVFGLVIGTVRKGERVVPTSALEFLMGATFPAPTSRVKAIERYVPVYPLLKEVAIAVAPASKANAQHRVGSGLTYQDPRKESVPTP